MTTEQKAKAYDEAIKRAKNCLDENRDTCLVRPDVIFPELKESEDERIRKALIRFHKSTIDIDSIKGNDNVAWLEKQGGITKLSEEEQNRFAKGVLTSCALSFIDYLDAHKYEGKMCVSNGECEDIENAFHNAMWDRLHRYYCKYIEKQGEQPQGKTELEATKEEKVDNQNCAKHADKVEPKFNIGDEIKTANEEPLTITKIDEKGYCSEDLFICSFDDADKWKLVKQKPADKVDPKFHEGDWIVRELDNTCYQIKKCILNVTTNKYGYDLTNDGYISSQDANFYHLWNINEAKDSDVLVDIYNNIGIFQECKGIYWTSYIYLGCDGELLGFSNGNYPSGGYHRQINTHPATKEQRDALMKAITDAGYTFDFAKKELTKVEQKSAEWNEEDEERITNILSVLRVQVCWDGANGKKMNPYQKEIDWLKSLKQRIGEH